MGAMRARLLAKTSVSQNALKVILSSHATMTVAYLGTGPVALRPSPCVRTAETWMTPSAKASVTIGSQELKTRIDGLVPMASKSVSSKRLVVTGIQIVTMPLN